MLPNRTTMLVTSLELMLYIVYFILDLRGLPYKPRMFNGGVAQ